MNNTNVNVEQTVLQRNYTIDSVSIRVIDYQLNSSVTVQVYINDISNNVIDIQTIKIEGEEYDNWGSDDSYLENLVLQKLGYERRQ